MRREVSVGTISWINRTPNPVTFAAEALALEPAWIVKTYVGLAATSNPDPGDTVKDFRSFQSAKNFRAMMHCRIAFDDDRGRLSNFKVLEAVHDPGWTPPFMMSEFPSSIMSFDRNVYSSAWHAGEASPISVINTQARHRNSAIAQVGAGETVLVNGLIKFRAGKHTDDVGIQIGSPYHVPWVWCEMLLTFMGGTFRLYGRGSTFPSHAWYVDGRRVKTVSQTADSSFPRTRIVPTWVPRIPGTPALINMPNPLLIDERALRIYPVLQAGASAIGPQVALGADSRLTEAVDKHPNTAAGTPVVNWP
jgi:hypothetical protein